jgi:hypothetical protein
MNLPIASWLRSLPHDRQSVGIVGFYWLLAPWHYHTGGRCSTGKLICQLLPVPLNYQGKAPGSTMLSGTEGSRPTSPFLPASRERIEPRRNQHRPPPCKTSRHLHPRPSSTALVGRIPLHRRFLLHLQATATSAGTFFFCNFDPPFSSSCFHTACTQQTWVAEVRSFLWRLVYPPQNHRDLVFYFIFLLHLKLSRNIIGNIGFCQLGWNKLGITGIEL